MDSIKKLYITMACLKKLYITMDSIKKLYITMACLKKLYITMSRTLSLIFKGEHEKVGKLQARDSRDPKFFSKKFILLLDK